MSEIQLDVGLAHAFRRHDYVLEEVQRLKEGDLLKQVLGVLCPVNDRRHLGVDGDAALLPGARHGVHEASEARISHFPR